MKATKQNRNVEKCTINADVLAHGNNALLINSGNLTEIWLPYSQIFNDDVRDLRTGDNIALIISYWIAKSKGLI